MASDFVNEATPALLAQYAATSKSATKEPIEAMLMMRPYLRSIMCRPNTWHARNVPVRFVSMSLSQSASEKSRVGARWLNPAALRRMSTFPNAWMEACSNFSSDPRSATSQLTRRDRRPTPSISSAITFTSSMWRALGTTSAPASASPRASVRPIPELPPITTATLPSRSSRLYPMAPSSLPKVLDLAHQSLIRGLRVAHQQQDQNHAGERHQAGDNHDGIEGMSARRLACIGKIADEFEGHNRSNSGASAAESAYRRY